MFTPTVASIAAVIGGLVTWIFHRMYPVKVPASAKAVTLLPGGTVDLAVKAQAAGLDVLVPLLKAIESANGPLIQTEAQFLHRLVVQYGGFAEVLDDAFNQILEERLKAGRAKYLMQLAADGGITARELLDLLEGKPAGPSAAPAVAVAVLAMLFGLFSFSSTQAADFSTSHWNADVRAPAVFYPTDMGHLLNAPMRDCNIPDPGPYISINYFYANWCGECAPSTKYANQLDRAGYNVIIRDAGGKDGASYARIEKVTSVPFWLVREDGREVIRTNDAQKVAAYLNSKKTRQASPVGYWPNSVHGPDEMMPASGQDALAPGCRAGRYYGNRGSYTFWDRGPTRRFFAERGRRAGGFFRRVFGRC